MSAASIFAGEGPSGTNFLVKSGKNMATACFFGGFGTNILLNGYSGRPPAASRAKWHADARVEPQVRCGKLMTGYDRGLSSDSGMGI